MDIRCVQISPLLLCTHLFLWKQFRARGKRGGGSVLIVLNRFLRWPAACLEGWFFTSFVGHKKLGVLRYACFFFKLTLFPKFVWYRKCVCGVDKIVLTIWDVQRRTIRKNLWRKYSLNSLLMAKTHSARLALRNLEECWPDWKWFFDRPAGWPGRINAFYPLFCFQLAFPAKSALHKSLKHKFLRAEQSTRSEVRLNEILVPMKIK